MRQRIDMVARTPLCGTFADDESGLRITGVRVPKVYVASMHLNIPVQCGVDGNTSWYRLVAHPLEEKRCEICRFWGQQYYHLLSAVYAYTFFFVDGDIDDYDHEEGVPHVFSMLSPHGQALDIDFRQFESMLCAPCYEIIDGAVFDRLGEAVHIPEKSFPLMLSDLQPEYHDNYSHNEGLTAYDMKCIEMKRAMKAVKKE